MKTVLKKIQILLLAILIGFGSSPIINEVSSQYTTTNSHYVLSRHSPNRKLIRMPQGQDPQNTATKISLPANTQESGNWGGYIVTPAADSSYESVSGSWTVPNISAAQRNAVAAQWVGLGGASSSDLLQMGTIEDIENGQPVAKIFWEKLPDAAQNIMSVPFGSTISANISKSSDSTWNLTFTVSSSGKETQTKTISTTLDSSYEQGIGTSAEWISEDPSTESGQLYPLSNMGTVKYQSAKVNGESLNAADNTIMPVAMVSNSGTIQIYPSELSADGESFTTSVNANSVSSRRTNWFPESIMRRSWRSFGWDY
jgi:hypothetical protein